MQERPQNRNLVGATVNASGAELANSSQSHECIVGSHSQAIDQCGASALSFSDLVSFNPTMDFGDGQVDVLGRKIIISVQKGKCTVTKVEGIPAKFCLGKLVKKLKAKDMLSCGGHVAKDKETGSEFIQLQGGFSAEVAQFLIQEGICDADCIVRRG
jgi:translation initiation factor SUI1